MHDTLELHEILNPTEPKICVVVEELRALCFCANLLNGHNFSAKHFEEIGPCDVQLYAIFEEFFRRFL